MKLAWYEQAKHGVRYFLLRRMPTCAQTVELISQSLDRPLTGRERLTMKFHLWICVWCLWYLEDLQIMRQAMRAQGLESAEADSSASATLSLSAEARERIKRQLANLQ